MLKEHDESVRDAGVPAEKPADESGNQKSDTDQKGEAEQLRKEIESLKAIKAKLVEEQDRKNVKHKELKEKAGTMEQQLRELQEQHAQVLTRLEEEGKERQTLKEILNREEARKAEELAALKEAIPEDKRGLIIESLPVDAQLDFIRKNGKFLLGQEYTTKVFPLPVHKPKGAEQSVVLSADETAIIAGKMPVEVALEIKRNNPDFFQRFKK